MEDNQIVLPVQAVCFVKGQHQLSQQLNTEEIHNLEKFSDKILLAELITGLERMGRAFEIKNQPRVYEIGPYTEPLWKQMSVVGICILVDSKLSVRGENEESSAETSFGKKAKLGVSMYLWRPHMHKDIMTMTEESKKCTGYGKKLKYLIPKIASKPLALLAQLGQKVRGAN